MKERLTDYLFDTGKTLKYFPGERIPEKLYHRHRLIMTGKEEDEEYTPRIPIPMFLSFESGRPLDYFISPDCLQYLPVAYKKDDTYITIDENYPDGRYVKRILRTCYALQGEAKGKYLAEVAKVAIGSFIADTRGVESKRKKKI